MAVEVVLDSVLELFWRGAVGCEVGGCGDDVSPFVGANALGDVLGDGVDVDRIGIRAVERGQASVVVAELGEPLGPAGPHLVFAGVGLRFAGGERRDLRCFRRRGSALGHVGEDFDPARTEGLLHFFADADDFGCAVAIDVSEQQPELFSKSVSKGCLEHGISWVAVPVDGPAVKRCGASIGPGCCVQHEVVEVVLRVSVFGSARRVNEGHEGQAVALDDLYPTRSAAPLSRFSFKDV